MQTRVLFVCLGNICRSPTAEGIFQHKVDAAGLSEKIHVDSAGTSGWHIGASPDERSAKAALTRGYDLSSLRGRQVLAEDFRAFDYVLAMDNSNLAHLKALAPADYSGVLKLLLSFGSQSNYSEVPDPYYGSGGGFELVLDLVEDACDGLLRHISSEHL